MGELCIGLLEKTGFYLIKMASRESLKGWCVQELSHITDCAEDIADYVFKIDDPNDVREYLQEFFGESTQIHKHFIDHLVNGLSKLTSATPSHPDGKWILKDKNPEVLSTKKQHKKKKQFEQEEKKKTTKYVSLYSKEGEARSSVRLPGRHPCECLAQKHALINNCTSCGRIVCQQEGAGPCYFCGSLVCTKAEQEVIARESKKSAKLVKQLMAQTFADDSEKAKDESDYEKAINHKNRLLEFDKSSARRTRVIDDECDYFSTNSSKWMSSKEKEILHQKEKEFHEKRHESRRNKKVTLDFAGRKVVEDNNTFDLYNLDPDLYTTSANNQTNASLVNHKTFPELNLQFQPSKKIESYFPTKVPVNKSSKGLRLQDKEFQEMRDLGMCLSMHQPWASLLVCGIKKVEGRSWYAPHRGRLWIAATVKSPSIEEIKAVESMYQDIYPNKEISFPQLYPKACLLGCVDVSDCLNNEEYKKTCSDNTESESPFVFVCENPKELLVKIPVKGQHKIWKLDNDCHKQAKTAQKISYISP